MNLNPSELWQKASQTLKLAYERADAILWGCHHVKYVDRNPFSVKETPYVADIVRDESQEIVVMKSAQTRISMMLLLKFFHAIITRGLTGIFYFPTDTALHSFVQGRVNPFIRFNQDLRNYIRDTDNDSLKMIGLAMAYFFGMKGKTQKESTAADLLLYDEFDLMSPLDVDISLERVAASPYKIKIYNGNPTIPDFGVHEKFLQSDQKWWSIKCGHCGKWNIYLQEMKFDPSWVEQGFLACQKCRKAVDVTKGQWVAKHPGRSLSGYQVSRLFAKNADYGRLFTDSQRPVFIQNFYNRGLGLPWADRQARVTKEHILKMCGGKPMANSSLGTTAGIDVNPVAGHRIVITRPHPSILREVVHLGVYPSLEDIAAKIQVFDVRKFVIDAQPDKEGASGLCKKFRGRGHICYYSDSLKGPYQWNDDDRTLTVNRTESLDASQRLLRDLLLVLPLRSPVVEEFCEECAGMARVLEKNEKTGVVTARYIELSASQRVDFRHALNYDAMCWYRGQDPPKPTTGIRTPSNIRELLNKEMHS